MGESVSDARPQLELVALDGAVLLPEPEPELSFDDFWLLYPRHEAKKDAKKAWQRDVDPAHHVAIAIALVAWRPVWRDKDVEFICLPATWLRGERWEDELPPQYRIPERRHESLSVLPKQDRRQPIPEHVKLLLAKLKGAKA